MTDFNARAEQAFADKKRLGVTDSEWDWAMGLACAMSSNGSKLGAAIIVIEAARAAIKAEREAQASENLMAAHEAIRRALTEAGIRNEVLRGMAIEVGLEYFTDACAAAVRARNGA